MNIQDAVRKCEQILDEERIRPTVRYETATMIPFANAAAAQRSPLARGQHPRTVEENPEKYFFRSKNFDLLCALLDQLSEQDRAGVLGLSRSRIADAGSFHHRPGELLGAGQWQRCSSELPLVAEFLFAGATSRHLSVFSTKQPRVRV